MHEYGHQRRCAYGICYTAHRHTRSAFTYILSAAMPAPNFRSNLNLNLDTDGIQLRQTHSSPLQTTGAQSEPSRPP